MALTQEQIAAQMVAQLRILDPSISAEIGTPERKIIDTVAEQIAESQIDLNLLNGSLDLTPKFGTDLDGFVALFGFGRQSGASAIGFVTFSRAAPSAYNIPVPQGTQVQGVANGNAVTFRTTQAVTLTAGNTSVIAPIQALLSGSQGNLAANTITGFANVGAPILGITSVTNALPTSNGADLESDAELKVRFRNTVFRNLAGTEDQYMALAVATQFSTKANVIGPISRYREYMQIPLVDDSTSEAGQTITVYEPDGTVEAFIAPNDGTGHGAANQWTTSVSNNPYAKYIYTTVPYFVTNGASGPDTLFYRQDTDFVLNAPPVNLGDTYREEIEGDIPPLAQIPNNPNVTFFNVYTGTDTTVTLPRPNDVVLLEYSYLSTDSRNDVTRNITNCVDVYVNGENPITTDAIVPPPTSSTNLFTSNPTDKFYYANFSRIGFPDTHPTAGHIFMALFWQPVTALPSQIVVSTNTYFLGTHYWAVEDRTLLGNTVRTRNGIEWDPAAKGMASGDPAGGPYTGQTIIGTGASSMTILGYTYDKNIIDLQTALGGAKQVTTDVLAHRATKRYFKFDVTVVYSPGANTAQTNLAIQAAVQNYLDGQYFGSVIQLSDLLVVIRNVAGVQNVRWSNDVINPSDDQANLLFRVTECNIDGTPRQSTIVGTIERNTITTTSVTGAIPAPGQFIISGPDIAPGTTITGVSGNTITISPVATGSDSGTFISRIAFNTDFYLRDSELPTLPTSTGSAVETLPGLIIRARAQNVFNIT